jgi:hypothetical protein
MGGQRFEALHEEKRPGFPRASLFLLFFGCAGAICRFPDPGNDEENALWVAFEEDVAVGWG